MRGPGNVLNPSHVLATSPAVRRLWVGGGLPPTLWSPVVPSAWLVFGGFPVVAGGAEASTVLWVVWVESEDYELASAVWVVVGDGCLGFVAEYADWVSVEYAWSEVFGVAFACVSALCCCASALVCLFGVGWAA